MFDGEAHSARLPSLHDTFMASFGATSSHDPDTHACSNPSGAYSVDLLAE